ncbi:MAG TPA: LytR C-terminal domain-containing protein [Marmoricola sp.]|nr:LytR C-terminal domain-containing protein [Marmoricola sp.]HNI71154.1 LytR C-terminal domain-containing protein [Marmoricola sp.]HNO39176.1 LytR C-terminal domain-containing protein [Marmoricola sp.]
MHTRSRNQAGFVMSSRLLALTISMLAVAALLYIAQRPEGVPEKAATVGRVAVSPEPSPSPTQTAVPPIKRRQTMVEIFNNSRVKGLAAATAEKAKLAGWNVIGTDNWYGTMDSTTVYYPPGLQPVAQALATDLGIKKLKPAIAPMRLDRLTVILTADYH